MDLLQRELARKKSLLAKVGDASSSTTSDDNKYSTNNTKKRKQKKYMKQSELRRLEEEEEEEEERQRQQQASKRQKQENEPPSTTTTHNNSKKSSSQTKSKSEAKLLQKATLQNSNSATKNDASNTSKSDAAAAAAAAATTVSPLNVTLQLRAFGLPVRFFGETHTQRLERLETALAQQHQTLQGLSEMEEFRLGQGYGIRNTFLGRDDENNKQAPTGGEHSKGGDNARTKGDQDSTAKEGAAADDDGKNGGEKTTNDNDDADDDGEKAENDPPKRVYKFLKGLLKQWEADLEARPSSEAKSVAGRNESKTLKQCKDYIRPLFKQLKRRKLEPGLQAHLVKIVEFAEQGEFVLAHDAYLDVAIGRAAWPIGVTMVGIHARSGRAKIESSNVAHVMNSELQRKYLTSVKRLLSYSQKKRTDVDPSKKVS